MDREVPGDETRHCRNRRNGREHAREVKSDPPGTGEGWGDACHVMLHWRSLPTANGVFQFSEALMAWRGAEQADVPTASTDAPAEPARDQAVARPLAA